MAINVDRFVTKEQDFGGLYNLSDNIRKQDAIAQQKQIREQERSQQMAAKRAATGKFLMDYLDPNDHLTGTNYDPQIVMGFQDLLAEGADLANKGADTNMLMMALAPKVKKLTEYSTKAKLVNDRLKSQLQQLKPNMGYDLGKLEQEARRAAFYDEQGQLKDISTVDPNTDWLTETIRMYPEKVTTDAGIDEFVKNSQKFENTRDVTRYTQTGGMQRSKVNITSPNWLIPDVDEKGAMIGLVPKYQIAVDGGQPVMHEFKDEKGVSKFAPVRVLDEGEYKSLLAGNPGIADWLRGQVKSAIGQYKTADGQPIDMNSPQAENVARAILYDELKRRKPGGITDVEVSKPTQIIVSKGGSGSTKKETPPWDLTEYPTTEDGGKNLTVPFQGYVVTAIGNNKLLAKNVIYYPDTKQFKVTEYTGRDGEGNPTGEKTSMIKASTFRQNIKGNNPQADMKEFDALVGTDAGKQESGGGTIKGSEVPKRAIVTKKYGAYYYNGKKII